MLIGLDKGGQFILEEYEKYKLLLLNLILTARGIGVLKNKELVKYDFLTNLEDLIFKTEILGILFICLNKAKVFNSQEETKAWFSDVILSNKIKIYNIENLQIFNDNKILIHPIFYSIFNLKEIATEVDNMPFIKKYIVSSEIYFKLINWFISSIIEQFFTLFNPVNLESKKYNPYKRFIQSTDLYFNSIYIAVPNDKLAIKDLNDFVDYISNK